MVRRLLVSLISASVAVPAWAQVPQSGPRNNIEFLAALMEFRAMSAGDQAEFIEFQRAELGRLKRQLDEARTALVTAKEEARAQRHTNAIVAIPASVAALGGLMTVGYAIEHARGARPGVRLSRSAQKAFAGVGAMLAIGAVWEFSEYKYKLNVAIDKIDELDQRMRELGGRIEISLDLIDVLEGRPLQ
ncbi:MAG TPA: hypothetical protein PKC28_09455 [Bdellovibrionales bacterium]|nr:hypothetical protein [Bdellovibrionales bacterium]